MITGKRVTIWAVIFISSVSLYFWYYKSLKPDTFNFALAKGRGCRTESPLIVGAPTVIQCHVGLSKDVSLDPTPQSLISVSKDYIEGPERIVEFTVRPMHRGEYEFFFHFYSYSPTGSISYPIEAIERESIGANYTDRRNSLVSAFLGLWAVCIAFGVEIILKLRFEQSQREKDLEKRLRKAEDNAGNNPQKAKPAWDVAGVKIEQYFDKNLTQMSRVFWLAVAVMAAGAAFIISGVYAQWGNPSLTPAAKMLELSGGISQLVGTISLVLYRSTMAQANTFISILERMNAVGMAVQILDSIPETENEVILKNKTDLIRMLLQAHIKTQ